MTLSNHDISHQSADNDDIRKTAKADESNDQCLTAIESQPTVDENIVDADEESNNPANSIENAKVDGNEKISTAAAAINQTDAKVTTTTISEDVVIVTVEDSSPESAEVEAEVNSLKANSLETTKSETLSSNTSDETIAKQLVEQTAEQLGKEADNEAIEQLVADNNIITNSNSPNIANTKSTTANSSANLAKYPDEEVEDDIALLGPVAAEVDQQTAEETIEKDAEKHIEQSTEQSTEQSINQNTEQSEEEQENGNEEVKEKKEAKLESYKQFVAEQFSNQKVDYPEVRVRIEANALPSKMYFIMNVLSAIIASYGLVTNSAAVVIGAMLVAMMLGPITGVALAIIDHRMPLLWKSLFTVVAGISLVVLVGFLIGLLHNEQPLTAEILSRTQPTSMDLMIALAGGTAGAYAMVSPHLSVAVVGVAVATALVPPLAASGILFAHSELQLGLGALLLAITNIIAIQFTNALVLWLLGFRRLVDDDYKSNTYLTFLRRNAVTLLLLAGLGSYLTINLQTNAKQQVFESSTKEAISSYFIDKGNVLTNTQFDNSDENQVVRAVIRGETKPSSYDVRQIEALITANMDENFPEYLPIKLQLRYLPVQVIEANPLITDKLDKTDAAILTN